MPNISRFADANKTRAPGGPSQTSGRLEPCADAEQLVKAQLSVSQLVDSEPSLAVSSSERCNGFHLDQADGHQ